jgi:hypothetical protein
MIQNFEIAIHYIESHPLEIYLVSVPAIGFPLALMSLFFYWLDWRMDEYWFLRWLKLPRFFLHMISYVETPFKKNLHMDYGLLDENCQNFENNGGTLYYVVATSCVWPIRVFLGLVGTVVFSVLCFIGLPFLIIKKICSLLVAPFEKKILKTLC